MIYFSDKNIAIITPPHTASGNIHKGLGPKAHWVIGPDPFNEENINHHCAKIPKGWYRIGSVDKELKVYIICRDPYTRLVGLFLHYEWSQNKGLIDKYLCWEEFVYNRQNLNWMFNKTITDFVESTGLTEFNLIRYENLEEELSSAIGEDVNLPKRYHDPVVFEEWYYDPKLLKYVNETWAEKDCVTFGYPII